MAPVILITGATGFQGGSAARHLLSAGLSVRAFVRDPSSPAALALQTLGAELVQGDFDNLPAITAAVSGVQGVFLNTYPSFTDPSAEVHTARRFVAAALASRTVKTFVISTVFKASEMAALTASKPQYGFLPSYYASKAGAEEEVKKGGFEHTTFLRPGWLNYNYLAPPSSFHFPEYQREHVLSISSAKDYRLGHFDPEDVGKFAARAFLEPEKFGGVIELSYEPLTLEEVASTISRVSGVEVKARFRSEEETRKLLEEGTLPALVRQIAENDEELHFDVEREQLEKYGIELGSLEGFLEREKKRLLETLGV